MSNKGTVGGYVAGFVAPNPSRDMKAFDLLPETVQKALREAPFNISAPAAYVEYVRNGEGKVLAEIAESVDLWLAACEREKA
jgi:hypothetical protein